MATGDDGFCVILLLPVEVDTKNAVLDISNVVKQYCIVDFKL